MALKELLNIVWFMTFGWWLAIICFACWAFLMIMTLGKINSEFQDWGHSIMWPF
jgi:uncharacterized membrane protein YccF (DUF307 family)